MQNLQDQDQHNFANRQHKLNGIGGRCGNIWYRFVWQCDETVSLVQSWTSLQLCKHSTVRLLL